ncbi:MAG: heavy metal-binding domain-containing protein [Cyclobacteriaceae bacterium]
MKNYFISMVFMAVVAPLLAQNEMGQIQPSPTDSIVYSCPMHPEITSHKPGKCPKCGMDLVQKDPASPGHEMNMMMCPMHGMVDMDHQHDEKKQNRKMMNGMGVMGIAMGAMMVVVLIIFVGR